MNKSKRVIIYLLILSAIAAISVFAVMQVKKRAIPLHDDYFIGNTAGNLYNGGYFCEDENGTVYFSNHLDSDALYSMNPDENGCKRIIASGSKDILSCGNYLFYFQHTENNVSQGLGMVVNDYGVFRIRNDGSNNVCLLRGMVSSLQLGGNYLYYQEGNLTEGSLSKIKINETTHSLVTGNYIDPRCYFEGNIYYVSPDDNSLYMFDAAAENPTVSLVYEGSVYQPIIDGRYIYFIDAVNDYKISRINLVSKELEVLSEQGADVYNLNGSYIFYDSQNDDKPGMYRMDMDGSNQIFLFGGTFNSINLTSRFLYFKPYAVDNVFYHMPIDGTVYSEFSPSVDDK